VDRVYAAIDLKSYYASAECVSRGLDPMTTNLVVADNSRTEKTICLAVSPALKAFGIPGRARLFEVIQQVDALNTARRLKAPGQILTEKSWNTTQLERDPSLAIDYIVATPRMAYYLECSANIYNLYLNYIAPEDIHIYSIDEVFLDLTPYLRTYGLPPRTLVQNMIRDVWKTTGITATAGIGSNLYLCKVAMDILAKHAPPDEYGVRIAELDEPAYRQQLWAHRPLTDFWRVGRGIAKKLESHGMYTMGDIAQCSLGDPNEYHNEQLLYKLFGVNAELLIDHAWGVEPCTISDIKAYRPSSTSLSSGQVLHCPYDTQKAKLIVREMTDLLVLDLVEQKLLTDQITLTIGYDIENCSDPHRKAVYQGTIVTDHYGRSVPKHAHGTANLPEKTHSTRQILNAMMDLYDRIVDPALSVRRITISVCKLVTEAEWAAGHICEQLNLFANSETHAEAIARDREQRRQEAELAIKRKFGKNAILRGMNLKEGAMTISRNQQIGGHKA